MLYRIPQTTCLSPVTALDSFPSSSAFKSELPVLTAKATQICFSAFKSENELAFILMLAVHKHFVKLGGSAVSVPGCARARSSFCRRFRRCT